MRRSGVGLSEGNIRGVIIGLPFLDSCLAFARGPNKPIGDAQISSQNATSPPLRRTRNPPHLPTFAREDYDNATSDVTPAVLRVYQLDIRRARPSKPGLITLLDPSHSRLMILLCPPRAEITLGPLAPSPASFTLRGNGCGVSSGPLYSHFHSRRQPPP
jgi:hypothetical protein